MEKERIALISVSDKEGLKDFAQALIKLGFKIIATGGTGKYLTDNGIENIKVSDITGFPEILGGRVKTLHPKIHGAILAKKDQKKELKNLDISAIELLCCNFYPFEDVLKSNAAEEEIIENIDIGGVAMVRAAAKNYNNVITVTSPGQYGEVIEELSSDKLNAKKRRSYAKKAFAVTSKYDKAIRDYLSEDSMEELQLTYAPKMNLRYGENPHQKAALYGNIPFKKIAGDKDLSFNNIYDLNSAVEIVKNFEKPAVSIIKHAVPCGVALGSDITEAYLKALKSDPMSAFGGIVGLNRPPSETTAEKIVEHFFEVVAAPDFPGSSLDILKEKKNLRIIKYSPFKQEKEYRKVAGGMLVQDYDSFDISAWKTVTERKPTPKEMENLIFAWKTVRYLRSNAVAIVGDLQTKGLGAGETARVGAVDVATSKLKKFFPEEYGKNKFVMASDAFFPFPDAVEKAACAGVKAIVQPGGSKNDEEVIETAQKLGISMILTGRRHFLH